MFFAENITRGDDPVYAFGTLLRQQRFTQANFDLNNLNRPRPLNDVSTRLSGNWKFFDCFQTQLNIRAADPRGKAAEASLSRSDQQLVHEVISKYPSVLLAGKHLEVVQHEVETARALLDASKTRVEAGIAVDSDELMAMTCLGERQEDLIEADGNEEIAWAELERAVGASIPAERRQLRPLAERHYELRSLEQVVNSAMKSRPDAQSLSDHAAAQIANLHAAQSGYGPTLTAFGSWQDDRASFASSGGNNRIAGAELRLDLLPIAKRQQVSAAKVAVESSRYTQAAAANQIRLEVTRGPGTHTVLRV